MAFVEDNGYLYSNETYKPVTYKAAKTYSYFTITYGTNGSHDSNDSHDDESLETESAWYDKMLKKQKANSKKQPNQIIIDEDTYQHL